MKLRFLLVVLGTVLSIALILLITTLLPAWRAGYLLSELQNTLSTHSTERVVSLIMKNGGRLVPVVENQAVAQVDFSNRVLSQLRLAPAMRLTIAAYINKGEVQYIAVSYFAGDPTVFNLLVLDGLATEGEPPARVDEIVTDRGRTGAWIRFTYAAPAEFRRKAYALGTSCLYRIGGCRTAEEVLPSYSELKLAAGGPGKLK